MTRFFRIAQLVTAVTALWLILFWPAVSHARLLATTDSIVQFFPWAQLTRSELTQGNLPLWNPYNGLGEPLLANLQSALFFPLTWLKLVFTPSTASILDAYIKVIAAALSAYALFRRMRLKHETSLVGGLAYAFMPHFIAFLYFPVGSAEIWIPLALLLTLDYLESPRIQNVVWLAVVFALQFFAGQAQTWVATVGFVCVFFLWFYPWRPLSVRRLGQAAKFFIFLPLALALAAVQLIPFVEYVMHSQAYHFRQQFNASFSLPMHLYQMLMPLIFGDPIQHNEYAWTGLRDMMLYSGIPIMLLVGCYFFENRPKREKTFYLAAIIVFWFVYLRICPGVVNFLFTHTPMGSIGFNKYFVFFNICLLIPAMITLDKWVWSQKRFRVMAVVAGVIALAGLSAWVSLGSLFQRLNLAGYQLKNSAVFLGLIAGTVLIMVFWQDPLKKLAVIGLLFLVGIDFYLINRSFVEYTDWDTAYPSWREVHSLTNTHRQVVPPLIFAPGFRPETNLVYGFHSIASYDALWPHRFYRMLPELDHELARGYSITEPSEKEIKRDDAQTLYRKWLKSFFQVFGREKLRDILAQPKLGWDSVTRLDDIAIARWLGIAATLTRSSIPGSNDRPTSPDGVWQLNPLPDPAPHLGLFHRVCLVSTEEEALAMVKANTLECIRTPVIVSSTCSLSAKLPDAPATEQSPGKVTMGRWCPSSLTLQVSTDEPRWLVVRDLNYPGWRAKIDGRETRIFLADATFRAIQIPAGLHQVRLSYEPGTLRWGALISALAWTIIAVLFLFDSSKAWRMKNRSATM